MALAVDSEGDLAESLLRSLQSATLIFAVLSALSLSLYSHTIVGLRAAHMSAISAVRDLLHSFYDRHAGTDDPDVRLVLDEYVLPLLNRSKAEWTTCSLELESDEFQRALGNVHGQYPEFLVRYLLPIEEQVNEAGRIQVQRVVCGLHVDAIRESLAIVALAVGLIASFPFFISTSWGQPIIAAASLGVVAAAFVQGAVLLSYFEQHAREELASGDLATET